MLNFIGTWKTNKGNLVIIKEELACVIGPNKFYSGYFVGDFYLVNEVDRPGFTKIKKDGNCLISPSGEIIIGSDLAMGQKLMTRKRSEEEKGWLL